MEAKELLPGTKATIISGAAFEGHTVKIINNIPRPDSDLENRRRILVELQDVLDTEDTPVQTYILPRLLTLGTSDIPVQVAPKMTQEQLDNGSLVGTVMMTAEPITDPMDPALDRFRPNADVVKRYVHRILPGGYTDVEYLMALRDERDSRGFSPNVALVGETQSGKTMFVQVLAVLAAERDGLLKPYPVFTISGNSGVTNYDLYGQTTAVIIDGHEVLVWMEGLVPLGARCGAFIYLDEWNAVPQGQAVSMHPMLDDRRFFVNTQRAVPDGHGGYSPEVVYADPNTWIIATINPNTKGTQTLNEATSNRFRWLTWDYDDATEERLIVSKTVRTIGALLREARSQRSISVPVGTSALQRFTADCAMFGVDNALWSFLGLFPPNERDRVQVIIEDGGALDLLRTEYPAPTFKPGQELQDDETVPELAPTWNLTGV